MATDIQLHYALEIEQALVGLLWHKPELLPRALQKLDPVAHISQPHLQLLLEALNHCYRELNVCDWAAVVEVLRDFDKLAQCGGKEGLNEIYRTPGHESLFEWYLDTLLVYAAARSTDPPTRPVTFSGGRGRLYNNKSGGGYDVNGNAEVAGRNYLVKGWSVPDLMQKYVELRFYPKR